MCVCVYLCVLFGLIRHRAVGRREVIESVVGSRGVQEDSDEWGDEEEVLRVLILYFEVV